MEKLYKLMNIPHDKALHALYGLVAYSFMVLVIPSAIAFGLVLLVALVKEVADNQVSYHTSDYKDFIATTIVPFILSVTEYFKG